MEEEFEGQLDHYVNFDDIKYYNFQICIYVSQGKWQVVKFDFNNLIKN